MREKETFTPGDITAVLEKLGRRFSPKWLQMELAAMASNEVDVDRLNHGIYCVTKYGIARAKKLFAEGRASSAAEVNATPAITEAEDRRM